MIKQCLTQLEIIYFWKGRHKRENKLMLSHSGEKDVVTSHVSWDVSPEHSCLTARFTTRTDKRSKSSHFRKQNTTLTWSKNTLKFLDGREHLHVYGNTAPPTKALVSVRHTHSFTLTISRTRYNKFMIWCNHL